MLYVFLTNFNIDTKLTVEQYIFYFIYDLEKQF